MKRINSMLRTTTAMMIMTKYVLLDMGSIHAFEEGVLKRVSFPHISFPISLSFVAGCCVLHSHCLVGHAKNKTKTNEQTDEYSNEANQKDCPFVRVEGQLKCVGMGRKNDSGPHLSLSSSTNLEPVLQRAKVLFACLSSLQFAF